MLYTADYAMGYSRSMCMRCWQIRGGAAALQRNRELNTKIIAVYAVKIFSALAEELNVIYFL